MPLAMEEVGAAGRHGGVAEPAVAAAPRPMRRRRIPGLVPLRAFAVFLLAWHLLSLWNANPIQLPSPVRVLVALGDLAADGELFENAAVSAGRLAVSLLLAGLFAVPLGFAMGLSERVNAYADPMVELLRPISGIAWIPLGLFIFGVGGALPVFIMAYVAFFPMALNTLAGVRGVDRRLVAAARTMGLGRWAVIRRVVAPAALPTMMIGVRLAFAGAWAAIIAAELIGSPSGFGYAIEWHRQLLSSPKVFAYLIAIGVVGYLCDLALQRLQHALLPWMEGTELA